MTKIRTRVVTSYDTCYNIPVDDSRDCTCIGLLVSWSTGLLVYWSIDLSVYWSVAVFGVSVLLQYTLRSIFVSSCLLVVVAFEYPYAIPV